MIKIRLARKGPKKKPLYRIVAVDDRRKLSGKVLEVLGFWNPLKKTLQLDKMKLKNWLDKGAQKSQGLDKILNK